MFFKSQKTNFDLVFEKHGIQKTFQYSDRYVVAFFSALEQSLMSVQFNFSKKLMSLQKVCQKSFSRTKHNVSHFPRNKAAIEQSLYKQLVIIRHQSHKICALRLTKFNFVSQKNNLVN